MTRTRQRIRRPPPPGPSTLLLYDADCGFCTWMVQKLRRRAASGSLRPVPLQSPAADRLLGGRLSEREKWESWHLVDQDGRLFSGGAAVTEVLARTRGTGLLARLSGHLPRTTAAAYRLMAANRGALGRLVGAPSCDADLGPDEVV